MHFNRFTTSRKIFSPEVLGLPLCINRLFQSVFITSSKLKATKSNIIFSLLLCNYMPHHRSVHNSRIPTRPTSPTSEVLWVRFGERIHSNRGSYAPSPLAGVGRFGAGSEGAVLLRSITARVSTTDSTLMVGRGLSRTADLIAAPHSVAY